MEELEPCPFCDSELHIADVRWHEKPKRWIVYHDTHPLCPLSGVSFQARHTKEKAIEHANLRISH